MDIIHGSNQSYNARIWWRIRPPVASDRSPAAAPIRARPLGVVAHRTIGRLLVMHAAWLIDASDRSREVLNKPISRQRCSCDTSSMARNLLRPIHVRASIARL
jgi:hypothetical protein